MRHLDPTLRDPAAFGQLTPVTVRFSDLDVVGHVNNVALAAWLEDGRVTLELPVQPIDPGYTGPVVVLADLHIQYLLEIRPGARVTVGTRVQRVGASSATLGQAVFADGEPAAIAEAVEVLIDPATRRPTPWPPAFRALLERHLVRV